MKTKKVIIFLSSILLILVIFKLLMLTILNPWLKNQIQQYLANKANHEITIGTLRSSLFNSYLELKKIAITPIQKRKNSIILNGEIASVKLKGIGLFNAIFKHKYAVSTIRFSNSIIKAELPFSSEKATSVFPADIRINTIVFDKIDLEIHTDSTSMAFYLKNGFFNIYDLGIVKGDSITSKIIKQTDFEADEINYVAPDSMYNFRAGGMQYSGNSLRADTLNIHPNYSGYKFTDRYQYVKNRIQADFSGISLKDFSIIDYFISGNLVSSYLEIEKMEMDVFRDKRKKFPKGMKPEFQDLIYSYPGLLNLDSLVLKNGNLLYLAHEEGAEEAGSISFNEIKAGIYNITNDSSFKKEKAFLELKAEGSFMNEGRLRIFLKAQIFDPDNTFTMDGSMSEMDPSRLNPVLEKSADVIISAGKIEGMKFNFIANTNKASGKLLLIYRDLNLTFKNKITGDTTAIKERIISFIANRKVLDSNPLPGEKAREGIIDFNRDPEKYTFNYLYKSLLSGMKFTVLKNPD